VGGDMKSVSAIIFQLDGNEISKIENGEVISINANGNSYNLTIEDVEIITADIPGWQILTDGNYTVALDLEITEELKQEGIARELVNKIQNLRKQKDFEVTDKIKVNIQSHPYIAETINTYKEYICGEILAENLYLQENLQNGDELDIDDNLIFVTLNN
jgi:isoleucyl-tRNA synthetase